VTFLTFAPAAIPTAHAADRYTGTGSAFNIAHQYANGDKFGGVTATTGTALEVARDSLSFLGSPVRIASACPVPPIE
jgi:hypothetical protein